jgi:hypothetical protein
MLDLQRCDFDQVSQKVGKNPVSAEPEQREFRSKLAL